MHVLAFDGRMGASGDMLLGALLDAGGDPEVLSAVEAALDVEYTIDRTVKSGIAATSVTVQLVGDVDTHGEDGHSHDDGQAGDHSHGEGDGHSDEHAHSHEHDGEDSHDHSHQHGGEHTHAGSHTDHTHAEGHGPHRSYTEVVDIVESMDLPASVEENALAVFKLLGEAEASVHGTTLSEIHFHEVGADDAIADIVGVCLLLDDLGVEQVVTTPVSTGGGTVEMSHGRYPVPGPATVEIARQADWAMQGGPLDVELLTPTGAALLGHFAAGVETLPPLAVDSIGYGAGDASLSPYPNVLRAIVGTSQGTLTREGITVLETNLDDATPEVLGGLQETLVAAGARDVSIVPTTMKKSRPGHLVKVIVKPADAERVARVLAAETGTLGIREHGAGHRFIADREYEQVTLQIGDDSYDVGVKVGCFSDGTVFDVSAEYDDAQAVARETSLATRDVLRRAEQQTFEERSSDSN